METLEERDSKYVQEQKAKTLEQVRADYDNRPIQHTLTWVVIKMCDYVLRIDKELKQLQVLVSERRSNENKRSDISN